MTDPTLTPDELAALPPPDDSDEDDAPDVRNDEVTEPGEDDPSVGHVPVVEEGEG